MATALSTFREPIRVLIGDNDPDIQFREDSQIDAAMRLVLNLGKVVGDQAAVDCYLPDALGTSVTPDLTVSEDAKAWAQLVLHSAKQFITDVSQTAWRTRAFSEVVGENREKIWALLEEIYKLEWGEFCDSSDYDA